MADDKELYISPDEEPRLKLDTVLNDGSNVFSLQTVPHLTMSCPTPQAVVIPAIAYATFNPSSLPAFEAIKEGDLIQVGYDLDHPIFSSWAPPEDYKPKRGQPKVYKVKIITEDALGYPIFIGSEAL